jgi:hypothetical protein
MPCRVQGEPRAVLGFANGANGLVNGVVFGVGVQLRGRGKDIDLADSNAAAVGT